MQDIVSYVDDVKFFIEVQLEEQVGLQPLPYPGMDKSGSGVCNFYLRGSCQLGSTCPFRHVRGDRTVVCKHWLRGLCKKGDNCEFLHEYDMTKMPECYFFSKFGQCLNKECPFLHIDPNSKIHDCAWYDRGFCRNGPTCKNRHVRRVACVNYINGFCPEGLLCKFAHPKWALPGFETTAPNDVNNKARWVCHHCGERGHKIQFCFKLPEDVRAEIMATLQERYRVQQDARVSADPSGAPPPTPSSGPGIPGIPHMPPRFQGVDSSGAASQQNQFQNATSFQQNQRAQGPNHLQQPRGQFVPRPISEVTCFKCGEKGHYANKCPKGHLAFLSKSANPGPQDD